MNKETIMFVDDADFMRVMVGEILSKNGYNYIGAASTEEALKAYTESNPDLILMDIVMPGENPAKEGFECIKKIFRKNPKALIAILSGAITPDVLVLAIRAGAEDIIVKPFKEDILIKKINKILTSRHIYNLEDIRNDISIFNEFNILNQKEVDTILRHAAFTITSSVDVY